MPESRQSLLAFAAVEHSAPEQALVVFGAATAVERLNLKYFVLEIALSDVVCTVIAQDLANG